ncbi:unnamed protein product, partial [Symbiodinium sp. CCMP2456]
EAHKKADILVVCDRFETGYDNSAVTLLGVDRKIGSDEKLVQIYSRANRRRGGKTFPKVIDFANHVSEAERAISEFSRTRFAAAIEIGCLTALSEELEVTLAAAREVAGDRAVLKATLDRLKEGGSEEAWQ